MMTNDANEAPYDYVEYIIEEVPEQQQSPPSVRDEHLTEEWDDFANYIEYEETEAEGTESVSDTPENKIDSNAELKEEIDDSADKYYCYDCRRVFKELEAAEQHECPGNATTESGEEQHVELLEYMCAFCESRFKSLKSLEAHQITDCSYERNEETEIETKNDIFGCELCGKVFSTAKALTSHSRVHKKENETPTTEQITCQVCNTTFATVKNLKLHMKIHDTARLRTIQEALPDVAAEQYNRLDHFFCEICNKSFDQNLLTVHKNMHRNVEEFICKRCNRQFENQHSYEVHQQLHAAKNADTDENVIKTGITDAAKRNAKRGIKSTHVATAKQTFPCQYCGHLFWRPHEKVRHERVHTGEKPYECEVCGKRFRVSYSLTLHLRTHTDIRPFVCATCNKRFKSQSAYTHHLRTHMNERLYACDLCDKSFRTSVQLCAHKNVHSKPFNCTLCNRPFASLFAVKAHMKSHAKSKMFENLKHNCKICGAVYARTGALRAHMKDQHGLELSTTSTKENDSVTTSTEANADASMNNVDDYSEVDAAARLLITAAADAENRAAEIENQESNITVTNVYLSNDEFILDFNNEEEVICGF